MTDQKPASPPPAKPAAATTSAPPSTELMTAQESDQSGAVPGVGPANPAQLSPGPVETIEAQGIGPRTPYPEGHAPPPAAKKETVR